MTKVSRKLDACNPGIATNDFGNYFTCAVTGPIVNQYNLIRVRHNFVANCAKTPL